MGAFFRPARIVIAQFLCRRFLVLLSVAVLSGAGCGQDSGSSGGQVLLATGFFDQTTLTTTSYTADTGQTVSLSSTVSIPNAGSDGGFIGLENVQGSVPILTTAAYLNYSISGSSFLVPSDVFPFSLNVPASGGASSTEVFAQLQLVSAARMDFLRENSGALPPVPFAMTVSVTVEGQSPAGDTFYSNSIAYNVTFTE